MELNRTNSAIPGLLNQGVMWQNAYDHLLEHLAWLSPYDHIDFLSRNKELVQNAISTPNQLHFLLTRLSLQAQFTLILALESKVESLIVDWHSLLATMDVIWPKSRALLLNRLSQNLEQLIVNPVYLLKILQLIWPDSQVNVLNLIALRKNPLMYNTSLFLTTLRTLSPSARGLFCNLLKSQMNRLIKNTEDLIGVLKLLRSEEQLALVDGLYYDLPLLIKNKEELKKIIATLPLKGQCDVMSSLGGTINKMITNPSEMNQILPLLSFKAQHILLHALKHHMKHWVWDEKQRCLLLNNLSPMGQFFVLQSMKELFNRTLTPMHINSAKQRASHVKEQLAAECLLYLMDKKQNSTAQYAFFFSKVPHKIEAATWLLNLLTKQTRYKEEDYAIHRPYLQSGRLGQIFNTLSMQNIFSTIQHKTLSAGMESRIDLRRSC